MRGMPIRKSRDSTTFSRAIGRQKLGQPVPDSNLVAASYRAVSQQMQRNTPFRCSSSKAPEYARSVPSWRVTW